MAECADVVRLAVYLWDSALAETHMFGFVDPSEEMPWGKVACRLSEMFLLQTGKGLSDNHLKFLFHLVRQNWNNVVDQNAQIVTFTEFCKRGMPRARIDFWTWLLSTLALCEKPLRDLWLDGIIEGFIKGYDAVALLQGQKPGTFLIRFDDFYPLAICILYVAEQTGVPRVCCRILGKHEILRPGLVHVVMQMRVRLKLLLSIGFESRYRC